MCVVAQWTRLLLGMLYLVSARLVRVQAVCALMQLTANAFREAGDDDFNVWVPAAPMGEPHGVPSSWLWPNPAQVIWILLQANKKQ